MTEQEAIKEVKRWTSILMSAGSKCVSDTAEAQDMAINALEEIQRMAAMMVFELERGNIDGFAELLNKHWELSKMIDAGSTNTCIDQIFAAIEDLLDGKMICGAGGGGFLQVILKKNMLRERLHETFEDCGVDVWNCTLV